MFLRHVSAPFPMIIRSGNLVTRQFAQFSFIWNNKGLLITESTSKLLESNLLYSLDHGSVTTTQSWLDVPFCMSSSELTNQKRKAKKKRNLSNWSHYKPLKLWGVCRKHVRRDHKEDFRKRLALTFKKRHVALVRETKNGRKFQSFKERGSNLAAYGSFSKFRINRHIRWN